MCVIGTTSNPDIIKEMGLTDIFMSVKCMPLVKPADFNIIINSCFNGVTVDQGEQAVIEKILEGTKKKVGIKSLLTVIEMAIGKTKVLDSKRFVKSLEDFGLCDI